MIFNITSSVNLAHVSSHCAILIATFVWILNKMTHLKLCAANYYSRIVIEHLIRMRVPWKFKSHQNESAGLISIVRICGSFTLRYLHFECLQDRRTIQFESKVTRRVRISRSVLISSKTKDFFKSLNVLNLYIFFIFQKWKVLFGDAGI